MRWVPRRFSIFHLMIAIAIIACVLGVLKTYGSFALLCVVWAFVQARLCWTLLRRRRGMAAWCFGIASSVTSVSIALLTIYAPSTVGPRGRCPPSSSACRQSLGAVRPGARGIARRGGRPAVAEAHMVVGHRSGGPAGHDAGYILAASFGVPRLQARSGTARRSSHRWAAAEMPLPRGLVPSDRVDRRTPLGQCRPDHRIGIRPLANDVEGGRGAVVLWVRASQSHRRPPGPPHRAF